MYKSKYIADNILENLEDEQDALEATTENLYDVTGWIVCVMFLDPEIMTALNAGDSSVSSALATRVGDNNALRLFESLLPIFGYDVDCGPSSWWSSSLGKYML